MANTPREENVPLNDLIRDEPENTTVRSRLTDRAIRKKTQRRTVVITQLYYLVIVGRIRLYFFNHVGAPSVSLIQERAPSLVIC